MSKTHPLSTCMKGKYYIFDSCIIFLQTAHASRFFISLKFIVVNDNE